MLAEDSKLLESLLQFKNIVCDTAALDQPTATMPLIQTRNSELTAEDPRSGRCSRETRLFRTRQSSSPGVPPDGQRPRSLSGDAGSLAMERPLGFAQGRSHCEGHRQGVEARCERGDDEPNGRRKSDDERYSYSSGARRQTSAGIVREARWRNAIPLTPPAPALLIAARCNL